MNIESGEQEHEVYSVNNILRHDKTESAGGAATNIWLAPKSNRDFIMKFGCPQNFSAIQLVNARNRNYRHAGVKKFR